MRLICDTGIRTGRRETAEAVNDRSLKRSAVGARW
jgi:hypothetical protein